MNRTPLAVVLLTALSAVSAVAMVQHGYVAIFERALVDSASVQLGLDLVSALALVSVWLVEDARRRGLSPWPWLVAIPALGSLSPLLYVLYARTIATPPTAAQGG